jgi:hypothetical protein
MTTGNEYYNIFSVEPCPGGPGTGPLLGLCAATPQGLQFILAQAQRPLGTPLTHFLAPSLFISWGPFPVPPVTIDGIAVDVTGGTLNATSPVVRTTIL